MKAEQVCVTNCRDEWSRYPSAQAHFVSKAGWARTPKSAKFYEEWKGVFDRVRICKCTTGESLLAAKKKKPCSDPVNTPSPEPGKESTSATSSSKGVAGEPCPRVTLGNITDDQLMAFDDLGLALGKI